MADDETRFKCNFDVDFPETENNSLYCCTATTEVMIVDPAQKNAGQSSRP
jgi:hypothetical protein